MKHYDNSISGNDCMIYEHWYWLEKPTPCAVKLLMVYGWCETPLEVEVYIKFRDDQMPEEIRPWFE